MATLQELKNQNLGGKLTLAQIKQKVGISQPTQPIQQPQGLLGKSTEIAGKIGEIGTDVAIGAAKGLGSSVYGLGQLGERALQPIFGGEVSKKPQILEPKTTAEKVGFGAEQIGEFFVPASGIAKGVKVLEKGIQASKTSKLLQGASKLVSRSILGAGETGAITAIQQGQLNEEVRKNMIIGGSIPIAGFALKGIAKAGISIAKKIEQTLIRATDADIKDGFKVQNIFKYDLGGGLARTEQKTHALITNLSNQLKTIIAGGKVKVNIRKILNDTAKEMLGNKAEFFGGNTRIAKTFQFLKQELKAISADGVVTLDEAQKIKRATGKLGAWQYQVRDPDANALEKVANSFYTKLKLEIERISPGNVKEINQQLSELIPIETALIRRIPVAARNNILSLSDAITAIPVLLNSGNWWLFALNRLLKSGNVANVLFKASSEPVKRGAIRTIISGAAKNK